MNAIQYNGSLQDIKQLLEQGADANAKDSEGLHALHLAARRGDIEIARLLLEKGADVNAGNNWGVTPLGSAAFRGHTEIAKLLLDKGADINWSNKTGDSILYTAVVTGKTNAVKYLLARGANVNTEDKMGYSPLDMASANHDAATVQMLQQAGATMSSSARQIEQLKESFKKVQEAETTLSNSLQTSYLPDVTPPPASDKPLSPSFVSENNVDDSGYVTNASLLKPFTVTNSAGVVFTDAVLVKLMPTKFIYKTSSGAMGAQRLDSLPADILQKIGYDPAAAQAADQAGVQKTTHTQAADPFDNLKKALAPELAQYQRALAAQLSRPAVPGQSTGGDIFSSIREDAQQKWPGDYQMQKIEVDKQTKAYNWITTTSSPAGVPQGVFEQIKIDAANKWPGQYDMQKYEIQNQIKAYVALH